MIAEISAARVAGLNVQGVGVASPPEQPRLAKIPCFGLQSQTRPPCSRFGDLKTHSFKQCARQMQYLCSLKALSLTMSCLRSMHRAAEMLYPSLLGCMSAMFSIHVIIMMIIMIQMIVMILMI